MIYVWCPKYLLLLLLSSTGECLLDDLWPGFLVLTLNGTVQNLVSILATPLGFKTQTILEVEGSWMAWRLTWPASDTMWR